MTDGSLGELSSDEFQGIAQWVFLQTMSDLEHRLTDRNHAGHRYQMLGLAPLLRKLLLDGGNLVNLVNRKYTLPLRFEIVPFTLSDLECHNLITSRMPGPIPELSDIEYWRIFTPGFLIPDDARPGESYTLPHFLRAPVGVVNRHRLTVKELIQFYCIVEGGVHIGNPRNKVEKDLLRTVPHELSKPDFGVDNSPIGSLFVCAEIVLKALTPLAEAIAENPTPLKPISNLMDSSFGKPRHYVG